MKGKITEITKGEMNSKGYITQNFSLEGDQTNYFTSNKENYLVQAGVGDWVEFDEGKRGTNDKGPWCNAQKVKSIDAPVGGSSSVHPTGGDFRIPNATNIVVAAFNGAVTKNSRPGLPLTKEKDEEIDYTALIVKDFGLFLEMLKGAVKDTANEL